jgi:hypothetical protein
MLQAVGGTPLRNRRGAIAKLQRARLADGVATVLTELRRHRRPNPRRLYWLRVGLGRGLIVLDQIGGLHLCTRWQGGGASDAGGVSTPLAYAR